MYDDVEADFWKEILVNLIHKNMVRTNARRFTMDDCSEAFAAFAVQFPEIKTEIVNSASYITWETFITDTIKLRLFIQSQVKVSFMQVQENDLVKVADGKFPYNPFPEIIELIKNKEDYEKQLAELKIKNLKYKQQQKITGEIIKALLSKKYEGTKRIYHLEARKEDFALIFEDNGETAEHIITMKNFAKEIKDL